MRTLIAPSRPLRLIAAAAAGFALAACGSGDAESSEETASAGSDPMAAYTECLEAQGIELPEDWNAGFGGSFDPENAPSDMPTDMPTDLPSNMPTDMPTDMPSGGFSAPEGVSEEDWAAAQEACMNTLPQGGGFSGDS
ncbi:hypothetical protein LO763_06030 [Glycomyces sp. A-F 0318]|uniref:hypothetical protein n=1 Tax=Glycomyces amatae TaxID=2881355 RepID=UPI001E2FBA19|nr:hypothetical protein [Glycomyces amatae]MCD0443186.1 hypothetical protein [Glycomyces amatae]